MYVCTIKTLSTVVIDIWKPDFSKAQKAALFVSRRFFKRPANPQNNTFGFSNLFSGMKIDLGGIVR